MQGYENDGSKPCPITTSLLTLGMHAPESYSTCVCVCPAILAVQAARWHISDTSGFRTMKDEKNKKAIFPKQLCLRDMVLKQVKANILHNQLGLNLQSQPVCSCRRHRRLYDEEVPN